MKSKKYDKIIHSIDDCIKKGKLDSLLNRMQFDYEIENTNQFSNYLVILLTLIEKGNYEISNQLFKSKIINSFERFRPIIGEMSEMFKIVKDNSVFPFVGISDSIVSYIKEIIYEDEDLSFLEENIPEKDLLLNLNFEFLKMYFHGLKKDAIYRNYMRLLYNCIEDIDKKSKEVKLSNEAIQFLKEILITREDIFNNYLSHFLRSGGMKYSIPNISSLQVVPEPFFEQIFGSIEDFEVLLEKSNSTLKNDIQKFLSKYKVNRKVFIEDLSIAKSKHEFLKTET